MATANDQPNHLIDSTDALADVITATANQTDICLDTEFMRVRTYAPQLALVQLAAGDEIFCVDPARGCDVSELWEELFAPRHRWIMHSAKQDFEALYFQLGKVPQNLFDTQIAAGLCGYAPQLGYAGLCKELLGIELPKSQTRSDWLQRPLTDAQLRYASEDVAHLGEMAEIVQEKLESLGRLEWEREDSTDLSNIEHYRPAPENAWQRVKSIPFMPPAEQARARALAEWREDRAVKLDKPRNWILGDAALRELTKNYPKDKQALAACAEVPKATVEKQGAKLIHLLREATEAQKNGEVVFKRQQTPDERHKVLIKEMGAVTRGVAEELGIAPEIVANKRDFTAILEQSKAGEPVDSRATKGWRKDLIGGKLLALL